jgi:hypothetical protein
MIRSWPFSDVLREAGVSIEDPRLLDGQRDLSGRLPLPLGALIGVATIVDVLPSETLLDAWAKDDDLDAHTVEIALGNYAPGRFGWVLANQRELPEPIPFTGRQDVLYELAPEYEALVDAQLGSVAP